MQESGGARGFDAQIESKRECVSARALVNEMLGSSKVGCMSVAYSQVAKQQRTAAVLHPGCVGSVVRTTKAANAVAHYRSAALWTISRRRPQLAAAVVVKVVVVVVGEWRGRGWVDSPSNQGRRNHNQAATAMRVHWSRGPAMRVRSGWLLRSTTQQTWAREALAERRW